MVTLTSLYNNLRSDENNSARAQDTTLARLTAQFWVKNGLPSPSEVVLYEPNPGDQLIDSSSNRMFFLVSCTKTYNSDDGDWDISDCVWQEILTTVYPPVK